MPWKNDDAAPAEPAEDTQASEESSETSNEGSNGASNEARSKAFTPKKGRPTPKRNEVERVHGVRRTAFDAPTTPAEARQRRKELKASMSKQEYKALRQQERDEAARARRVANERMMSGDEQYLLQRDRGKEKRFVRDWVDSHRYLMNLFMPLTLVVVVIMIFGMSNPDLANLTSIIMLAMILIMVSEGLWLGRRINREVNARFPDNPHGAWALGFYAFTRATMIRRFRTPAPQRQIGDKV